MIDTSSWGSLEQAVLLAASEPGWIDRTFAACTRRENGDCAGCGQPWPCVQLWLARRAQELLDARAQRPAPQHKRSPRPAREQKLPPRPAPVDKLATRPAPALKRPRRPAPEDEPAGGRRRTDPTASRPPASSDPPKKATGSRRVPLAAAKTPGTA